MALGIAVICSEERCIAAFSIKANLLREGGVGGRGGVRDLSSSFLTGKRLTENSNRDLKPQQYILFSISPCMYESHRVVATLGARHDQARVQSVPLSLLVPLPRLVHMCSHTMDLPAAHTHSGFYADSIVLYGFGG